MRLSTIKRINMNAENKIKCEQEMADEANMLTTQKEKPCTEIDSTVVYQIEYDIERIIEYARFSRKMELYCMMYEDVQDMFLQCNFIERKYHEYYKALGREGLEALRWREDYIKQALEPTPFDILPKDKIAAELWSALYRQV